VPDSQGGVHLHAREVRAEAAVVAAGEAGVRVRRAVEVDLQRTVEGVEIEVGGPAPAIGFGTANWSIIVPTTGEFRYPEPGAGIADSPDAPPLWEAFTARRRSDGLLEIPACRRGSAPRYCTTARCP